MITYGYSVQGTMHTLNNIPCQDYHTLRQINDKWYLAVIADGVGSAENSAEGAETAVNTVADFCEKYMPISCSNESIKAMIKTAFNAAMIEIKKVAEHKGADIQSFDTTLTVAVYDGNQLIYGHSGDGGIVIMDIWGNVKSVTSAQKGADWLSVIPLRAGENYWIIDEYEDDVTGVTLFTDGLYDVLMPYLLRFSKNRIYLPMALHYFSAVEGEEDLRVYIKKLMTNQLTIEEYYDHIRLWLKKVNFTDEDITQIICSIQDHNYPVKMVESVTDDRTVVAMLNNNNIFEKKEMEYYKEPDWIKYREEWNKCAYPHLYTD